MQSDDTHDLGGGHPALTPQPKRQLPPGIDEDTPLRLPLAAKLAFPDGSVSPKTLRLEIDRGRLVAEKIGRHMLTTLNAIENMRILCRVPQSPHAFASGNAPVAPMSTSSSIVDMKAARASALNASEKLKKRSLNT